MYCKPLYHLTEDELYCEGGGERGESMRARMSGCVCVCEREREIGGCVRTVRACVNVCVRGWVCVCARMPVYVSEEGVRVRAPA
jgi:hypothetical protein